MSLFRYLIDFIQTSLQLLCNVGYFQKKSQNRWYVLYTYLKCQTSITYFRTILQFTFTNKWRNTKEWYTDKNYAAEGKIYKAGTLDKKDSAKKANLLYIQEYDTNFAFDDILSCTCPDICH